MSILDATVTVIMNTKDSPPPNQGFALELGFFLILSKN